jgi:hypothetical protein
VPAGIVTWGETSLTLPEDAGLEIAETAGVAGAAGFIMAGGSAPAGPHISNPGSNATEAMPAARSRVIT